MKKHKGKLSIIITFAILFVAITVLLLLVFFAGKKTYTVRFDLDGGTLISGSLEQHVVRGQNAVPPVVVKDGAYLRAWSDTYNQVTEDRVISAIWEYETTVGIIYANSSNQNFTEIVGAYKYIQGEVYLGAYYGDKKILGIRNNAFSDCVGITKFYLLDGLIYIGEEAFSGCTALAEIEIPSTVTHISDGAFRGCESLERIVLNEGLLEIGAGAFEGCANLKEIVLPASLVRIAKDAFAGCDDLVITVTHEEGKSYDGWEDGWHGSATVVGPDESWKELKGPFFKVEFDPDRLKNPSDKIKFDPDDFKKPSGELDLDPDGTQKPSDEAESKFEGETETGSEAEVK